MINEVNSGFSNVVLASPGSFKGGNAEGVRENTPVAGIKKNDASPEPATQFTPKIATESAFLVSQSKENIRPENVLADIPGNTLEEIKFEFDDFMVDARNRRLEFSKDEETGKTVIRVIDTESGEVVRQIPPQEFLDFVRNLNKVAEKIFKGLPKFI